MGIENQIGIWLLTNSLSTSQIPSFPQSSAQNDSTSNLIIGRTGMILLMNKFIVQIV
jgi:hypothetical protein